MHYSKKWLNVYSLGLDMLFSSTHNIHKRLWGLCFRASDILINRFYKKYINSRVWSPKKLTTRSFMNVVIWQKSITNAYTDSEQSHFYTNNYTFLSIELSSFLSVWWIFFLFKIVHLSEYMYLYKYTLCK